MARADFIDFINQKKPDAATVQQAAMLYVGELTDDLPTEELKKVIIESTKDPAFVERTISELEKDYQTADSAILTFLAEEWKDPEKAEKIRRAFDSTKKKLPVIVPILIATVAMYAIYAVAKVSSGEKKESKHIFKRRPDGTIEETDITKYEPLATPDQAVKGLFGAIKKAVVG